jgi:Concanavalin A-like lectin/glucanases superfamily
MTLYVNGLPNGNVATLRAHNILSQVKDDNNWLGRSQWAPDPLFQGVYDEFRIYSKALSAAQIAEDFARGPDVVSVLPTDGGTAPDAGAPDAPSDAASGQ